MSFNLRQHKKAQNANQQYNYDTLMQYMLDQVKQTGNLPTEEALNQYANQNRLIEEGIIDFNQLQKIIQQQLDVTEQSQEMQQQMIAPEVEPGQSVVLTSSNKKENKDMKTEKKVFNLKKAQLGMPPVGQPPMDDMGLNDNPEMIGDEMEMQDEFNQEPGQIQEMESDNPRFKDGADVRDWVNRIGNGQASDILIGYINEGAHENYIRGVLSEEDWSSKTSIEQEEIGLNILKILPPELKLPDPESKDQMYAPFVTSCIEETNKMIKKMAKQDVKKENKSFNLSKTAQHQSVDNTITYGPDEKRIDPFYRMPVSDWHIIERNKGWGQDIGGIWNIDYETIWRENIMDKYSRPYRDKEGNWVGGYIQKRFEVDKNIPETNNLQLKPGQRRRPILPEYGNTESRLQAARAKGDIEGGPVVDRTEPFNWKEAQTKKKSLLKSL